MDECPLTSRKPCWFIAEFFVLKAYRKKGIGRDALKAIVERHPSDWHVAVPLDNQPAQAFWGRALSIYNPESRLIDFDGSDWRLNTFTA